MRTIGTVAALMLLVGCNTPEIYPDFPRTPMDAKHGRIVMFREDTLNGVLAAAYIGLDGRRIASIRKDDRIELVVEPGIHSVGSGVTVTFEVKAGETYWVQIGPYAILRLTESEAAKRVSETALLT